MPLNFRSDVAQGHSQDMADHNFMAHNGSDGSSPFDRMQRAGYRFSFAGENVAAGQSTPEDAISRNNIMKFSFATNTKKDIHLTKFTLRLFAIKLALMI